MSLEDVDVDAILEQLRKEDDAAKPIDDELVKKLSESLQEKDRLDTLVAKIRELGQSSVDIDQSFHTVLLNFDDVQEKAGTVLPGVAEQVPALKTKWGGLRKKYVDLLWNSREVASKAKAVMDDVVHWIPSVKNPNVDLQQKIDDCDDYLSTFAEHKENTAHVAQDFTDLSNSVRDFMENDWEDFKKAITKAEGEAAALKTAIQTLNTEITDLQGKIIKIKDEIEDLIIRRGILIGIAVGTGILGCFCPLFWIDTVAAAAGAIKLSVDISNKRSEASGYQTEVDEKIKDRDSKQTQLDKMENALKSINEHVSTGDTALKDILAKLIVFTEVWNELAAWINDCFNKLELMRGSKDAIKKLKTLKTLSETDAKKLAELQKHEKTMNRRMGDRLELTKNYHMALSLAFHEYRVALPKDLKVFANRSST